MKICEQCGQKHNRKRFCSNKCKDTYHNLHNPRGKFSHLKNVKMMPYDPDADCHPFSSEALGQD